MQMSLLRPDQKMSCVIFRDFFAVPKHLNPTPMGVASLFLKECHSLSLSITIEDLVDSTPFEKEISKKEKILNGTQSLTVQNPGFSVNLQQNAFLTIRSSSGI